MNRSLIFVALFPFIVWIIGIAAIVLSVMGNFKKSPGHRAQQAKKVTVNRKTGRIEAVRPQMEKGLFDMDLGRRKPAGEKKLSVGGLFRNTGFDRYVAKGRRKDFVDGYDRRLSEGGIAARRAAGMQFSHTYDGHEPWDKCLPKEKDPWDPDFYA